MEPGPMVFVRLGHERARIYWEGGIGFEHYIMGIGWCVDDEPSKPMADYAVVMRNYHCRKHLEPLGADACSDEADLTPASEWTIEEILAREG